MAKFIDLFAGIGGFHQAGVKNNLIPVFASEIDLKAKETYEKNYGLKVHGDITRIKNDDIPKHDYLFAGFPCQTFSRSGNKQGFNDTRGTLFFEIARIAKFHQPKFMILENVRSLTSHDYGRTFDVIMNTIKEIGYVTTKKPLYLSPVEIGIPQRRVRTFIVCVRKDLISEEFIEINIPKIKEKHSFISKPNNDDGLKLTDYQNKVLDIWEDFRKITKEIDYSFSIWIDSWFEDVDYSVPEWKLKILLKNKEFFSNNKNILTTWLKKHNYLNDLYPSHKKFEWSAGKDKDINNHLVQFRPSGVRVIKRQSFPTITTIANQNPVIMKDRRRVSLKELASLQSFDPNFNFIWPYNETIKQLGNAVNVEVVSTLIKEIKKYD